MSKGSAVIDLHPAPSGFDRVRDIDISNIRINDLSIHDGLKIITVTDTGQNIIHKVH